MLQKIRDKTSGWIAGVIIALIAGAFVLFGVTYYFEQGASDSNIVVTVNGVKITRQQLDISISLLQRQEAQKMGAVVYLKEVKDALRDYALQSMITQTALKTTLQKEGFLIGLPQLKAIVMSSPSLQENGKFSPEKFQQVLLGTGMTPDAFFHETETQWVIDQGVGSLSSSAFSLPSEIDQWYALSHQRRAFGYAEISALSLESGITVTDADIKQAYQTHSKQYQTAPKVSVSYLLLPPGSPAASSEQLANLTFTNPDSLSVAAKALALPIQTSGLMTRTGEKQGIFADPKVLETIFSDSVFQQENNSDPISLPNGGQIVLRIAKKIPSRPIPLAQVEDKIKAQWVKEKAEAKAGLLAVKLQEGLKAGKAPEALLKPYHLQWHSVPLSMLDKKPSAYAKAAFEIFPDKKAYNNGLLGVKVVTLDNQRYGVVGLTQVEIPSAKQVPPDMQKSLSGDITELWGALYQHCFVNSVMRSAKIK